MNVNKDSFIKLRRGLMEHLESGKINGRELSVYVALHMWVDFKYGFCWKISSPFLAHFLNEKEQIVKRCMKSLSDKGYIKRFNHRGQKTYYPVLINHYEIQSGIYTRADKTLNSNSLCLRVTFNCTLTVLQMNFKCPLNDLQVSPIKEVNNIRIVDTKNKDSNDSVKNIVDYLNSKIGTKFDFKTKATIQSINARLKDYSIGDIRLVINSKCSEWQNDDKMKKHLNPTTLFRASNFERYYNALKINSKKREVKLHNPITHQEEITREQ